MATKKYTETFGERILRAFDPEIGIGEEQTFEQLCTFMRSMGCASDPARRKQAIEELAREAERIRFRRLSLIGRGREDAEALRKRFINRLSRELSLLVWAQEAALNSAAKGGAEA